MVKKIWGVLKKVVSYICIAAVLFSVISLTITKIKGRVPNLFGYSLFIIATGSMEPSLSPGDVIISRRTAADELKIGDVVTFNGTSGELEGKMITHQIIELRQDSENTYITTKGTANDIADPEINAEEVVSVMVRKTAFLTFVYSIISTKIGFFLCIFVPLAILVFSELVKLIFVLREKEKGELDGNDQ